jgi:hypothetical protein
MQPLKVTCLYKDGKFTNEATRALIASRLKDADGKIVTMQIEEFKPKRSSNQNRFWFGVVIPLVRSWFLEHGYNFDAEEVHDYIVRRVWKHTEVVNLDDEPYERRLSSTKLEKPEWEKMVDLTRVWGAERGLQIPFPKEYGY